MAGTAVNAPPSPPRAHSHTLVCCDSDHGSSSRWTPPVGDPDIVMADPAAVTAAAVARTMTNGSTSSSSSLPSISTAASGSSTSASSAPAPAALAALLGQPPAECESPCPFETYCCLDEHCAPDCKGDHPPYEEKSCPEACSDPTCDDGCEAECCDDPSCEAEWCLEGCTIEEYLECCANACTDHSDTLGLLPTTAAAAPLPTPPYLDLISAAFNGQLMAAPPPVPIVVPPLVQNVCHWQNCHRTFESMPQLLAHIAADHLGSAAYDTSAAVSNHQTPAAAHLTPASHSMSSVVATPQTPILPMGFDNSLIASSHVSPAPPASAASQGQSAPPAAASAPTGDVFSCLWDDCFSLDTLGFGSAPGAAQLPTVASHTHPHALAHAHPHPHPHSDAGGPLSPQTMLRHLLEEHLGIAPMTTLDANAASSASTLAVGAAPPAHPAMAHDHAHAHHAHGHGLGHDHSSHVAHDHVHVHDGHEHTHPHGHAHAHPHAHTPRPKPYSRPESSASTRASVSSAAAPQQRHSHAHPHPHAHSHFHKPGHGPSRTPAHHHHVKFPLSPSSPSSSLPSDRALTCLWPGCTHTEPFESTGDLMAHLSEEHVGRGRDKYRCLWDGCGGPDGRLFRSRQKVLRHLQSHTGHRPFVCHVCGQSFSEAAPLAAHLRRHSDDKPYVCDFPGCGKAFAISSSLTIHKRTHNGDKPFICSYCGKGFVEASNLTKHVRTHTGERPFVCAHPDCGRAFSRPDQLKRHMLVHEAGRGRNKNKDAVKKEVVAV